MAFQLPKQSIVKGSVFHKSVLKARKSALKQEEEVVEEPKRNLFENIFSKEAGAERRAKRNPEGKSPREIKLEKELERMQNFGDASKFEIKAMERRIGRAQTDRLASQKEEIDTSQEELDKQQEELEIKQQQILEEEKAKLPQYGEGSTTLHAGTDRPTGYHDPKSEEYMKGVETYDLATMPKFSPERKAYYEARNWAPDKTVDPNFGKPTGVHAQEDRGSADAPYQGVPSVKVAHEGEYYQHMVHRKVYKFKDGRYIELEDWDPELPADHWKNNEWRGG